MKSMSKEVMCPQCCTTIYNSTLYEDNWCSDCQILIIERKNNYFDYWKHLGFQKLFSVNEFYLNKDPYIIWNPKSNVCKYCDDINYPNITLPYNTPFDITLQRIQKLLAFI